MPSKPKNNYDIKEIEALVNRGYSLRAIARKKGWGQVSLTEWLRRNYRRVVKYVPIKRPQGKQESD